MNNRPFFRVFAGLALLCSLGGCASLSKSECLHANWEDIGTRDGANGHPEEYLIRHSTACAKVGVAPDRGAWMRGRDMGLERFCTPHRVFQLGEYGSDFEAGICRNFDQERLQDAYEKGRDVHRRSDELSSIDNEIRSINTRLEGKDKDQAPLENKEREALMFRLGVLTVERAEAQRAYDRARHRARDL